MHDNFRKEVLFTILRLGVVAMTSYFSVKWIIRAMDPTREGKGSAKLKAEATLRKLGINDRQMVLNDYELTIASQLVNPDEIEIEWDDIAGLDDVIEEIKTTVILPLQCPNLYTYSRLLEPPKGVLLYGPPGVGKTMIAKATAKEAGARFINLDISSLTDKWYGESQKLAAAVFTLAVKIQPCIVFIDEIDTFLRSRKTHDHEATSMMKAQFMVLWDGLISNRSNCSVIVMGATNRPHDVDHAIRRRMPATFHIGLPDKTKRLQILKLILSGENLGPKIDLDTVAKDTQNFSGSDLKELCRVAAMIRVTEEAIGSLKDGALSSIRNSQDANDFVASLRPIINQDFSIAVEKVKKVKINTETRAFADVEWD